MMTTLNIAVAAEFELCEKIAEALEQSKLNQCQLSIVEICPFSEEQGVRFNNKAVAQIEPEKVDWSGFDYMLFAGTVEQVSHVLKAAESGCIVLDLKGICAALDDVPVVVPTVNESRLMDLRQRNIAALPDPQVSQFALLINEVLQNQQLSNVSVTSLLPASYVSGETVGKLAGQTAQLLNGIPLDDEQQRLAFDVFPILNTHLVRQAQKIFPQLENLVFHAIQVPVFYGMGQMISAVSNYELDSQSLMAAWQQNALIQYHQEKVLTPVTNGEQETQEEAPHLHISAFTTLENNFHSGFQCWSVADEQRFNMAILGVKLLERVVDQGF